MRGSLKSRRLSWASDVNLCKVRLFLSEEPPSQVGLGAQDHLQAKISGLSHSTGAGGDDILPPGFEGSYSSNQLQISLSEIPTIKWRCPPKYLLDLTWQVVAGEESKELEIQSQREVRVLEAYYPRPSAIPPNPSVAPDIENASSTDQQTPSIPVTPIEDDDAAVEAASDFMMPFSTSVNLQPGIPVPPFGSSAPGNEKLAAVTAVSIESDVVAAASAAMTALSNANERGSMIDQDLLIKILSNPQLVEKLMVDYGTASSSQNLTKSASHSAISSSPVPPPLDPSSLHINRTENILRSTLAASSASFHTPQKSCVGIGPPPNSNAPPVPVSSSPGIGVQQGRDMNYYKNLIQQHGADRVELPQQVNGRYSNHVGANQETVNNQKPRETRLKIMKPCIYYNSPRGCRNGANCAYQHDASSQQRSHNMSEVQSAKRMKMDREISS